MVNFPPSRAVFGAPLAAPACLFASGFLLARQRKRPLSMQMRTCVAVFHLHRIQQHYTTFERNEALPSCRTCQVGLLLLHAITGGHSPTGSRMQQVLSSLGRPCARVMDGRGQRVVLSAPAGAKVSDVQSVDMWISVKFSLCVPGARMCILQYNFVSFVKQHRKHFVVRNDEKVRRCVNSAPVDPLCKHSQSPL